MSEIKCPHCGEVFKVDEQGYAAIVAQVKTAEFDKELDKRVADEKDKALKLAKLDFDSKYTKAVNDKDMEIQKLKAAAANGESEKTLAVTKAQESTRAEYEKMLEQLKEQISQNEKLIAYRSDQIYDHRKRTCHINGCGESKIAIQQRKGQAQAGNISA